MGVLEMPRTGSMKVMYLDVSVTLSEKGAGSGMFSL